MIFSSLWQVVEEKLPLSFLSLQLETEPNKGGRRQKQRAEDPDLWFQ
jgi:hypothetical protein